MLDAAVSADATPADAGVVVVVDAAVDAGAVAPDAGSVDGRLVEPLLADGALKARFEAALKQALDDPQAARPSLMRSLRRRLIFFAPYNAALCRLRRGDKEGGLARLQQVHDRFGMLFHGATEALAWAKYNDGDKEGAESLLRQAMDAHPRP